MSPFKVQGSRFKVQSSARPSQDTPAEMVNGLLSLIRAQFCTDLDDKKWFSLQDWFRQRVVLWPARFMSKKGFTLPVKRYDEIMRAIFQDIKRHVGQEIRHWPSYLLKCVQSHWEHQWEDYYAEAKSARSLVEQAIMACKKVEPVVTVEPLAQAAAILTRRSRRPKAKHAKQLEFL